MSIANDRDVTQRAGQPVWYRRHESIVHHATDWMLGWMVWDSEADRFMIVGTERLELDDPRFVEWYVAVLNRDKAETDEVVERSR